MLSRKQIDDFWRDGYLAAESAVAGAQLPRRTPTTTSLPRC